MMDHPKKGMLDVGGGEGGTRGSFNVARSDYTETSKGRKLGGKVWLEKKKKRFFEFTPGNERKRGSKKLGECLCYKRMLKNGFSGHGTCPIPKTEKGVHKGGRAKKRRKSRILGRKKVKFRSEQRGSDQPVSGKVTKQGEKKIMDGSLKGTSKNNNFLSSGGGGGLEPVEITL